MTLDAKDDNTHDNVLYLKKLWSFLLAYVEKCEVSKSPSTIFEHYCSIVHV